MIKPLTTLVLAFVLATTLSACGEPEDTLPGQPIKHRRAAFKQILQVFEPMGVQLRTNEFNNEKFLALAQQLEAIKDQPWSYFVADSAQPPSKAKAEVWQQGEKFTAAKENFLSASSQLLAAASNQAQSNNIAPAYAKLKDSCENCHKSFKQ